MDICDYGNLNEETKTFFRKAMEIYALIENKSIVRKVKDRFSGFIGIRDYTFTKLDKKIISLFIAGLLVDGDLKDIFSQYDDIKLDDLLEFIGIKEEDIVSLSEEDYEEFYNKKIRLDLISIIDKNGWQYEINSLTPTVIVELLRIAFSVNSVILDYFSSCYISDNPFGIMNHPIFAALKNYNISKNNIVEKQMAPRSGTFGSPKSEARPQPSRMLKQLRAPKVFKITDDMWKLCDSIEAKFIGQERAVEDLFNNIVNNQVLANMEDIPGDLRSIIFIDGPSGTGKTAITKEITEQLGLPFVSRSVTDFSYTGYVGGNLTEILVKLYEEADGDLELAQRGIVVLDEFDKLAGSGSDELGMKKAVQQQLLDFLGGGKYPITVNENIFDREVVEFDTSKLTFVCLGALTKLRLAKTKATPPIGFGGTKSSSDKEVYTIGPKDLEKIGLEKELVARINTYLHTDDYSVDMLERILRESAISPLIGLKMLANYYGKNITVDDDVYRLIAELAYESNYGARSLDTVVKSIRNLFLNEMLRSRTETIHLDVETVMRAIGCAVNRQRRG